MIGMSKAKMRNCHFEMENMIIKDGTKIVNVFSIQTLSESIGEHRGKEKRT